MIPSDLSDYKRSIDQYISSYPLRGTGLLTTVQFYRNGSFERKLTYPMFPLCITPGFHLVRPFIGMQVRGDAGYG